MDPYVIVGDEAFPLREHTVSVKKKLKYVRCGTVTVLCWYALGTLLVRSWFALGALLVRSWYAHGSLESSIDESVRYGTRFGRLAVGTRAHARHARSVRRCENLLPCP